MLCKHAKGLLPAATLHFPPSVASFISLCYGGGRGRQQRYELNKVSVILHRFSISWGRLQQRILGYVLYSATWTHRDIGLNERRTGKKTAPCIRLPITGLSTYRFITQWFLGGDEWFKQTTGLSPRRRVCVSRVKPKVCIQLTSVT